MTTAIIITFCILLLVAYVFDLTSSKTKIPGEILRANNAVLKRGVNSPKCPLQPHLPGAFFSQG
jgi:hypothetical protein